MTKEFLINQKGSVQDISCSLKLSNPGIEHLRRAIKNEKENKDRAAVLKMLERALKKAKLIAAKTGVDLIAEERKRQIEVKGISVEEDVNQYSGRNELNLIQAAICYLIPASWRELNPFKWPWISDYWKPTPDDRIRELQKAGALIAAEIDRLTFLKKSNEN